jgi:hypothetical protein
MRFYLLSFTLYNGRDWVIANGKGSLILNYPFLLLQVVDLKRVYRWIAAILPSKTIF